MGAAGERREEGRRTGTTHLHEAERGDLLLHEAPAERGVGDPYPFQVEVAVRVLVQEVGDVRHIYSRSSNNWRKTLVRDDLQNPAY